MKPKPEEKTKEATCHPKQPHWHEMNRKQRLVRYGMKYVDQGAEFYEAQHRNRQINCLKWKATKLGFQIIDAPAA